ncbi:unnamed protein product [Rhizoctonia solani]|uniref:F-box domain-containing protein n=1 Tax=Rhizoctonia solani TaxID=456999 RepID=A0A8H3DUG3_9AGAM|nr:unnamed protein product [Rhizoctonia solani]
MFDQLGPARDQLQAALDKYYNAYSTIQGDRAPRADPDAYDTELVFVSSCERTIKRIKVAMNSARNYSSGLSPIGFLPPEILSRIFHLMLSQPCKLPQQLSRDETSFLKYPESLARVCTLWRRTVLSSYSLWRHIDLSPYESVYNDVINRAEMHLERSGDLPIELHITESEYHRFGSTHGNYNDLYDFVSRISSRVGSLELILADYFRDFHCAVFRRLVLGQAQNLTKLVIHSQCDRAGAFILTESDVDSSESDPENTNFGLNLTEDQLEKFYLGLTVVHLRGIFPRWSSVAYQGLVDLRLMSTREWSGMSAREFIPILEANPRLQVLHFGLEIEWYIPADEEVVPIYMEDLQIIKIFTDLGLMRKPCPSKLLRLLTPGPKPLYLCFNGRYNGDDTSATEFERFFARSKVTRFYTQGTLPPLPLLLQQAANIELVIFDKLECYDPSESPYAGLQVNDFTSLSHLESLHILRSKLLEHELRLLLNFCPTGITLYSCRVECEGGGGSRTFTTLDAEALSETFPTVTIADDALSPPGDPTIDWDVVD